MRQASIKRSTSETKISVEFVIDGTGRRSIVTGVPFLDHMLDLFAVHGVFDLNVQAQGDIHIDAHHTTEDVGICLGDAFRQAIGDAKGIHRYASECVPMDEALCQIAVDISNRPHLSFDVSYPCQKVGEFDVELVEEFLRAFVNNARVSMHINVLSGDNTHHIIESCFKAVGRALDQASQVDPRKTGVPSSKGVL